MVIFLVVFRQVDERLRRYDHPVVSRAMSHGLLLPILVVCECSEGGQIIMVILRRTDALALSCVG